MGEGTGSGVGQGSGVGSGQSNGRGTPPVKPVGPNRGLQILSKPRPAYTEVARKNNIQGVVTLRITFLANGQIGSVSPVQGLPHGLTERAIAAARQIKFLPEMRNGKPVSVTKRMAYTFTIY
jgi:protein TonB